jgi:SH3-like domain-containing protein
MAGALGALVVVGVASLGVAPVLTPAPVLVLREAPPSPTVALTASLVAVASPSSVVARSRRARIVGAGQEEVNLRAEPGTRGARLKGLVDGTELEVLGHEVEMNGRGWKDVRDPTDGAEGWVAAEFLGPAR